MNTAVRFLRFNAVGALGIGVQLVTIWTLMHFAGASYVIATIAGVSVAIGHNFLWHLGWTWRDRGLSGAEAADAFLAFAAANGGVSIVGNLIVTTALVERVGFAAVPANAVAIAACGLVNFWLGDRIVFQPDAYSSRRAVSGSTLAARRAGITPASTPTSASAMADPATVSGSRGDSPYSSVSV
jgi:dolichol-phosphate mannosyltransferase